MTTSFRDWQPGHLHLSAAALQLLLKGPDHDPSDILRIAVRELVGLGLLMPTTLQSGEGMQTVHTAAFGKGRAVPDDLEGSLHSITEAFATATAREGLVTIQELARSLRDAHGGTLAQWVEDDVLSGAARPQALQTTRRQTLRHHPYFVDRVDCGRTCGAGATQSSAGLCGNTLG